MQFQEVDRPLHFKKTAIQEEASEILADNWFVMLFGGSRSGKTFILIYMLVVRALKCKSRHLIVRFAYKHAKRSIVKDTFPTVMRLCFPGVPFTEHKADGYYSFGNGSEIWIGGTEDQDRLDQILGTEYSTIMANECSQIPYQAITTLLSRLAEKSDLVKKFWMDCNPGSKKHWSYEIFFKHIDPDDKGPYDMEGVECLLMNPEDNLENIDPDYLKRLEKMPAKQRRRFLKGQFQEDVQGALWDMEMIDQAKARDYDDFEEIVIGVDPSGSSNKNSDLCGISVAGRDINKIGVVLEDHSMTAKPGVWGQAAVNLYHEHGASCIVAETNYGGDMVETIINNIDPNIKVVKVHAKKGKLSRAEPISQLYELEKVAHGEGLEDLETEMQEFVPLTAKASPNRMDAAVYALYRLMLPEQLEPMIRVA